MVDAAVDTAEKVVKRGHRKADAALESAREYGNALEDHVAANPLGVLLVALGVGCVIGFLMRR